MVAWVARVEGVVGPALRSNSKSLPRKRVGMILGLLVGLFAVAVSWPMPLILGGPDGSIGSGPATGAIPSINFSKRSEVPQTNVPPVSGSGLAAKGPDATETETADPVRAPQRWSVFDRMRALAGKRHERVASPSSGSASSSMSPSSASSSGP